MEISRISKIKINNVFETSLFAILEGVIKDLQNFWEEFKINSFKISLNEAKKLQHF
ncbi:hypothetical protein LCGC14_1486800 [marine sediment metagenome]|uniref:Uncharacterized protein n=1 Tax=marine sediment metagenome TaxID=412755 RepID=A0A0F9LNM5_9ZZZZ